MKALSSPLPIRLCADAVTMNRGVTAWSAQHDADQVGLLPGAGTFGRLRAAPDRVKSCADKN